MLLLYSSWNDSADNLAAVTKLLPVALAVVVVAVAVYLVAVAVTGRKGSIPPVVNTLLVVGYNAGYKLGGLPILL